MRIPIESIKFLSVLLYILNDFDDGKFSQQSPLLWLLCRRCCLCGNSSSSSSNVIQLITFWSFHRNLNQNNHNFVCMFLHRTFYHSTIGWWLLYMIRKSVENFLFNFCPKLNGIDCDETRISLRSIKCYVENWNE